MVCHTIEDRTLKINPDTSFIMDSYLRLLPSDIDAERANAAVLSTYQPFKNHRDRSLVHRL